jgi:transcriptional regulator
MYIPKINLATDQEEIIAFMKRFSFATIITSNENIPIATHLPFLVSIKDDQIVLTSHFAKANDHWKDIETNNILVIFTEPHAYISTKQYDKELNVPTWNYISVHAYGKGKLITETENIFKVLEHTIENYETEFLKQWNSFSIDYKTKMADGIVAFEIIVNDLQAKNKLSQNRSATEKQKIIDTLKISNDTNEQLIANYMKNEQKSTKEIHK